MKSSADMRTKLTSPSLSSTRSTFFRVVADDDMADLMQPLRPKSTTLGVLQVAGNPSRSQHGRVQGNVRNNAPFNCSVQWNGPGTAAYRGNGVRVIDHGMRAEWRGWMNSHWHHQRFARLPRDL